MTIKSGRGCPRRNTPLAKRNEDQDVSPDIQGDVLRDSIDRDMYHERIGRMGARKYLRESFSHHIECSAANFIITFM